MSDEMNGKFTTKIKDWDYTRGPKPEHPNAKINRETDAKILEEIFGEEPPKSTKSTGGKKSTLPNNVELDPHGTGAHEPGAKMDAGKMAAGLFFHDFPRAIKAVIEVVTFGMVKYSPSGWLTVPNAKQRYRDALYRHLLAMESQDYDKDSGYLHLAHAAWNALALLELELRGREGQTKEPRVKPEWSEG